MNPIQTGSSSNRGKAMRGSYSSKDIIPKGYKTAQLNQYDPQQRQLYQNQFDYLSPDSDLARLAGGDEEAFAEMEAPALRQFNELQGNLASRFSGGGGGQGSMSSRRSSGFQNAAYQQGSDFAQQLQSQRLGIKRQALQDLMGMSSELLGQRPTERALVQKPQKQSKPALGGWGSTLGALGGAGIGFMAGGPAGAATGGTIGYKAMKGL